MLRFVLAPNFRPPASHAHLMRRFRPSARLGTRDRILPYQRARYYDVVSGEFISQDPLEYVDGMSLYRGYLVPGGVDPLGLDWTIKRKGGEKAMAIKGDVDDTIESLAAIIGLDVANKDAWLTVPVGDDDCYEVPNVVFSIWAGDGKWIGKTTVAWSDDVKYLQERGFRVKEHDYSVNWRIVQTGERKLGNLKIPVFGREPVAHPDFLDALGSHTKNKSLHGLFFWGHGLPHLLASKAKGSPRKGQEANFIYGYDEMSKALDYKLGFVLLNACFTDYKAGDGDIDYWHYNKPFEMQNLPGQISAGGRDLSSGTAGHIFDGSKVVLSPFQRIPGIKTKLPDLLFEGHTHPSDILRPGDQGTIGGN